MLGADPAFVLHEATPGTAAAAPRALARYNLVLTSETVAETHHATLVGPNHMVRLMILSSQPAVDRAVRWIRAGAADYCSTTAEDLAALPGRVRAILAGQSAADTSAKQRRTTRLAHQLATVVEKVGDGLTLVDEHGRFILFNREMRRITGLSRSTAGGLTTFLHTIHPDPAEFRRAQERVREALATRESRAGEVVACNRTGATLLLSVVVSPVQVGDSLWALSAYKDITARRRAEVAVELRESRAQTFNQVLLQLARNELLFRGDRTAALHLLTETAARSLGAARVGVWFYEAGRTDLHCVDLFEQDPPRHSSDLHLAAADYPAYFAAVEKQEIIAAGDAAHDPATRCFAATYLQPLGIGAMLDVPVRVAGRIVGVVCHEHVGPPRTWSAAEQAFASAIGSCVSLALEAEARHQAEAALHAAHDRLNEIVEFLPDATFVIDAAGTVTAWNRAMEEMTGVPKAEMLGRGHHEYALPFYGERRPMLIDLALRRIEGDSRLYETLSTEGRTLFGEAHVPCLGGGRGAYVWGSARPLFDQHGRLTGALESIRDVTQRKQAENEIVAWKRRYELVAAASGQITYEYNLETGFILWSDSVERVLGYPLAELGGTLLRWLRLIHPADRRRTAACLHRSVRAYTPFDVEYRMRHHDGSHLWFRDRGYYIITADRARCMIGMLTDITAGKQAAEALQRAHAHLEERVRERTAELATANSRLRGEIAERERIQQALTASEQKYRLMVDSLPQVVYELDLHGNVLVLNREGVQAARVSPEELARGVNLFSLVHPEDHGRLRANWTRLLAGHHLGGEEYRFLRRDGSTFHGSSYAHLIVRDERPVGVTGFLIDETHRKQAEEALRRAHADLEDRVIQRTAELAESNASLRQLLEKQEMNIGLAHQVLLLVNAEQPRNSALPGGCGLFAAGQSIPRCLEGGDHFFVRRLAAPAGLRTLVSLKDQSGHEVGCILRSIITDLLHNALVGAGGAYPPGAEVITRLNREICRSHLFQDGDFFTSINLEIDHATLQMTYVVAGHPPFLLVRDGAVLLLPDLHGSGTNLPVGMLDHHEYGAAALQLQPGDQLILYTDGLLEAPAARQRPHLSSAALADLLRAIVARQPEARVVTLANLLFREVAGCTCDEAVSAHGLPDDVALVALEIERPAPTFEDCLRPASLAELRAQRVRLAEKITAEWRSHGVTTAPMRLHVVLEEALYNAWHHGNREDPAKSIVVRRRYGNDACLEILDEGAGFGLDQVGDPTAHENRTKPSGRGLFLIRRFADEARWSDSGRHLTMHFGDERTFTPSAGRSPLPRLDLWNTPRLSTANQPRP